MSQTKELAVVWKWQIKQKSHRAKKTLAINWLRTDYK